MTRAERAQQLWSILVLAAQNRQVLTYEIVGRACGLPPPAIGDVLRPVQQFCSEQSLPPLTSIIVSKQTGLPGDGFIAAESVPMAQLETFEHTWSAVTAPSAEQLADAYSRAPDRRWAQQIAARDARRRARLSNGVIPPEEMRTRATQSVCEFAGVEPAIPAAGSKLGIALGTLGRTPIHGLRLHPEAGTNGWYIWCGSEASKAKDFYSPLHIEHIGKYLPVVSEYLSLPPGFCFLIDGGNYEDVWFDASLLEV